MIHTNHFPEAQAASPKSDNLSQALHRLVDLELALAQGLSSAARKHLADAAMLVTVELMMEGRHERA